MTDLVEFLQARLDEDEAAANDAVKLIMNGNTVWDRIHPDLAAYVWSITPARVLADVMAIRALIVEYEDTCADEFVDGLWVGLQHFSQRYADHDDFDPAWKITTPA